VNRATLFTDPPEELELSPEIVLRPGSELWQIRGTSPGGGFAHGDLHYPVLSVPIGEADELACPDEHVEFLRKKLTETQPLHILVVGYSGNDREVIDLLQQSGRGIKTLTIVDLDQQASKDVYVRMNERHGITSDEITVYEQDFNHWVASGELDRYVERLSGLPI
jgi:hypothetical protein